MTLYILLNGKNYVNNFSDIFTDVKVNVYGLNDPSTKSDVLGLTYS